MHSIRQYFRPSLVPPGGLCEPIFAEAHVAILLGVLTLALGPPFALVFGTKSAFPDDSWICLPDGKVINTASSSNAASAALWDPRSMFNITLGFGKMPFHIAKIIDVAWDICIGRFGQVIATIFAFRVLSRALLHTMETRPAAYDKFTAITLYMGSFASLCTLVKDVWTGRRSRKMRPTLFVSASIFVTIYILFFPSLLSAVTGYQAVAQPYLSDPDSNGALRVLNGSVLQPFLFKIIDGSRIGYPDNYVSLEPELDYDILSYITRLFPTNHTYYLSSTPSTLVNDTTSMFSFGTKNVTHDTKNVTLDAPSLTIEYTAYDEYFYGDENSNHTFDLSWIDVNIKCVPTDAYEWGFSFLGLLVTLIFTSMFVMILYMVWVDTYCNSQSDRLVEDLGLYQAITHLAIALKAQFGEGWARLGHAQIEERLRTEHLKMTLKVDQLPPSRTERTLERTYVCSCGAPLAFGGGGCGAALLSNSDDNRNSIYLDTISGFNLPERQVENLLV